MKLSAIHPRYEPRKSERLQVELLPGLLSLAKLAKDHDVGLTIDAEEAERLDLSIGIFEKLSLARLVSEGSIVESMAGLSIIQAR